TAIAVELALLASLGPVIAFFSFCTASYPFMVLLNVLVFAISGFAALAFLRRALASVFGPTEEELAALLDEPPADAPDATEPGASGGKARDGAGLATRKRQAFLLSIGQARETTRRVFKVWLAIFAVVGAQMGWVLRPFIGDPRIPFTFFRARQSNFFEACLR